MTLSPEDTTRLIEAIERTREALQNIARALQPGVEAPSAAPAVPAVPSGFPAVGEGIHSRAFFTEAPIGTVITCGGPHTYTRRSDGGWVNAYDGSVTSPVDFTLAGYNRVVNYPEPT